MLRKDFVLFKFICCDQTEIINIDVFINLIKKNNLTYIYKYIARVHEISS